MAAPDVVSISADISPPTLDIKHDRDREKTKSTKSSSSAKSKDLSHVPCKFFRVGSCTAGSSCPFSHTISGPGQQKDPCAWFMKGTCKFGHKCALAHILPGQSPAMDRRNKKAAQIAAVAGGSSGAPKERERDREKDRDRDSKVRKSGSDASGHSVAGRGASTPHRSNPLLPGSTAPTRVLPNSARPPLPISISKAAPAPAETAPALRDADFTSHDVFGGKKTNGNGQREGRLDAHEAQAPYTCEEGEASNGKVDNLANGLSSPILSDAGPFPVSTPSRPHRFAGRHGSSPSIDFGPIGSPPRASPSANTTPVRINGFSPGTSPRNHIETTQPLAAGPTFAAPGVFMNPSSPPGGVGSGLAASLSLGATRGGLPQTQAFAVGSLPVLSRPIADSQQYSEALDDEDMEELVPSSLKDLLTPEEQNRRMSRTSSSHASGAGGIATSVARPGVHSREDSRHRHSRSVPGASLLSQNLRSIWSDAGGELGQSESVGFGLSPSAGGAGALGTSPSFAPSPTFHAFENNDGPSPSMLNPSNASAAFLGVHQVMGAGRVPGGVGTVRAVSHGNIHHQGGFTNSNSGVNPSASSSFDTRAHVISPSPSQAPRPPFDTFSSSPSKYTLSPHRPVPAAPSATFRTAGPEQALSPGSRALQAHVPGQSLPQGLAAGFSRIHLQPTSTAFSPGSQGNEAGASVGPNGEWLSATPTKQNHYEQQMGASNGVSNSEQAGAMSSEPDVAGLTNVFSHISYSSVAASGLRGHHGAAGAGASSAVPTSMSRRSSARGWSSHPLSSPLSGPVLTNDDDELFSMDEEK